MLKVGLTGSIATGKSLVAELLAARGCRVLHADLIAHELMAPGKPAYEEIVSQFGRDILGPTGVIDRQRLAKIVFANRQQLEQLNRILHPRVLTETEQEMARLKQADPQAVVVLEAGTGAVRALVSKPSFDPNAFVRPALAAQRVAMLTDPAKRMPMATSRSRSGWIPPLPSCKPALSTMVS